MTSQSERPAIGRQARLTYPFAAIVGQEPMKLALLLNAINPRLGGVLIRGEKGTAKSTAVRALAELLPEIDVVAGCPYACPPEQRAGLCQRCQDGEETATRSRPASFVELPVGATEDRVVGSIDLEQAILEGERRFEPGLLAAAHRGILYVDEVNLLNDHLVDVLLDAAAMGRNYVEREGISVEHPAEFILVGTMNPEEGELRPQLLDRFALAVDVAGLREQPLRAEVVRRRLAFEHDPAGFVARWAADSERLRAAIARAQRLLPEVQLDDRLLDLITYLCCRFEVDGLRADIVIYKTAQTLAAYEGRTTVTEDDVRTAAQLALPHRRRRQPFDRPDLDPEQLQQAIEDWRGEHPPEPDGPGGSDDGGPPDPTQDPPSGPSNAESHPPDSAPEQPSAPAEHSPERGSSAPVASDVSPSAERVLPASPTPPTPGRPPEQPIAPASGPFAPMPVAARPRAATTARGRRSTVRGAGLPGHYVSAQPPTGRVRALALDATLRASAPHQRARRQALGSGMADSAGGRITGTDREVESRELAAGCSSSSRATPEDGTGASGEAGTFTAARLSCPIPGTRKEKHPFIQDVASNLTLDKVRKSSPRILVRAADLREQVRETKAGNLVLFVVDASGSMAARERMALAKGACLQLLKDAYQKRDRVGLIAFRGQDAQLLLPPTNSVDLAERRLRELPTGGRTPLGQGLRLGLQVVERYRTRLTGYTPLLVVLSDWRPNVAVSGDPIGEALAVAQEIGRRSLDLLVVDGESGPVRLGFGQRITATTGGAYIRLDELREGRLATVVRHRLQSRE